MPKINSIEELKNLKKTLQSQYELSPSVHKQTRIRIAMATCSIAAGSRDTIKSIEATLAKEGLTNEVQIIQTGCLGYCYAEPTVEVTLRGEEPVVFSDVDAAKAAEIVSKFIKNGQSVCGILPQNYKTID